jgi:plastocyanin
MSIWGRRVSGRSVAVVAAVLVVVAGLARVVTREPAHEFTIVARDMAFYLDGDAASANPVIAVRAGELVRVRLENRDRGMTHDFAVPAANAATSALDWNEDDEVTFRAPDEPGRYEYVCRPHLLMMKGVLKVD